MKNTKRDTFIYDGLGFPIRLVNVPMRKVMGEWAIDINFNYLQKAALNLIVRKETPLTSGEIKFIIDYLELSRRDFANLLGVTHTAVLKWEKGRSRMNPATEVYLRLYILHYLKIKDKGFKEIFLKISPKVLAESDSEKYPIEIDLLKIAC